LESHAEEIFAIAHKYEVEQLKNACEHFMASKIGMNFQVWISSHFFRWRKRSEILQSN